jgi:hypothetical protein
MESAEGSCFGSAEAASPPDHKLSQDPKRAPLCLIALGVPVKRKRPQAMSELISLIVAFLFGFACGYAVRAAISRRRRLASKMVRGYFN